MTPPEIGAAGFPAAARDLPSAGRIEKLAMSLLLATTLCMLAAIAMPSLLPLARGAALRLLVVGLVRIDEPPARVDAVAVHGGGPSSGSRELAAIRLWQDGRTGRLVAMGGPLPAGDPDRTYARAVERRLRAYGAPDEAIVRLDEGGSTVGELIALRRLAESERWHEVVLTSSRWHTRRIGLLAAQVFAGSSVGWSVTGPPELGFDPDDWWDDQRARELVLGEWAKIGFAFLFPARPYGL
jgi:uncharacterized SAM-binding protein YcdF (DUF218 family)